MTTNWTGDGADALASTSDNWDNGIPSDTNDAVFDGLGGGSPTKDCSWDIATVLAVTFAVGYTGLITQTATEVHVLGALSGTMGLGAEWDIDNQKLYIDGDYSVTGDGRGIRCDGTGSLFLGGDINTSGLNNGINMTGTQKWHNSKDNPTVPKEHRINNPGFDRRLQNQTIGINQTLILEADFQTDITTFETATAVKSDGTQRNWDCRSTGIPLIDPHNCTWGGASGESVDIRFRGGAVTLNPADYGNCDISALVDIDFVGTIRTTAEVDMGSNGVGTLTCNLKTGGKIYAGAFGIGAGVTNKCAHFTQEANTHVEITGDAELEQDDTVETNIWERTDATSTIRIEGQIIVGADAELDWANATGKAQVGGYSFDSSANISTDAQLEIIGDGTINSSNGSNGNRNIQTYIADGGYFKPSGNTYTDDVIGPVSGEGFIVGTGTVLLRTYQNKDTVTVISDTDGALEFSYAATTTTTVADYGNAAVSLASGQDVSQSGLFRCWSLEVYRLTIPSNTIYTFSGDVNLQVDGTISITNASSNQRGGEFRWESSGTLVVRDVLIRSSDGIQTSKFQVADGAGPITVTRDFTGQAVSEVEFLGDGFMSVAGDLAVSSGTVDYGTSTLRWAGSDDQDITLGGNPHNITENKGGGTLTYLDAWVATGEHNIHALDAYNVVYLAGGAYGSDKFNVVPVAPMADTTYVTINSSDGSTQFDYTAANAGPTVQNVDFSNMNFLGVDQPCATETCLDTLNNNTSPPTPGLEFVSAPKPPTSYGTYSRGYGIGIGVGVPGGTAYETIN